MKNYKDGKSVPLPCISTAFAAKTVPLPCVSTAFAAKTVPFIAVPRSGRSRCAQPPGERVLGKRRQPPNHPPVVLPSLGRIKLWPSRTRRTSASALMQPRRPCPTLCRCAPMAYSRMPCADVPLPCDCSLQLTNTVVRPRSPSMCTRQWQTRPQSRYSWPQPDTGPTRRTSGWLHWSRSIGLMFQRRQMLRQPLRSPRCGTRLHRSLVRASRTHALRRPAGSTGTRSQCSRPHSLRFPGRHSSSK